MDDDVDDDDDDDGDGQVVEIFVEMGGARNSLEVYVTYCEDMLLSTTADFYSRESQKWAEEDSFPDYMCAQAGRPNLRPNLLPR